ncbi:MAG: hypothetical protein ACK5V5_01585 [Cyclobacteriaceae bacterium]|jgi:hypothetical protein|nr:hypothetical protein [Flammeovirgaceae bacterium]
MRTRANNRKMLNLMIALGVIVTIMLAAPSAQAQSYHKAKEKHFKMKYKKQLRVAGRECKIMLRKRNKMPRQSHIASLQVKTKAPKYKPLAEVDPPGYVRKYEFLASTKNE